MAVTYSKDISPIDALWALYQSQSETVRKAFRERILSEKTEKQEDEEAEAMRAYESQLPEDVRTAVNLMAISVKKGVEEVRQASKDHTHVGRSAEDFLLELEND